MKQVIFFLLFWTVSLMAQNPFTLPPIVLYQDTTECQAVLWGDYDGDGWSDLYITRGVQGTGATATNLFFVNNNGVLSYQSMGALTSRDEFSASGSWGDYNNDGYLDLYVAVVAPMSGLNNNLFMNDGMGGFVDKTGSPDVGDIANDAEDSGFVGWGDYNNDGYLDMFVDNGRVVFFGGANYPYKEVNSFYENSSGVFSKKTDAEIGDIVSTDEAYQTYRSGFAWCDYNNDGYLDIYNGSGYGSGDRLWKNNQSAMFLNTLDFSGYWTSTRSVSWGDFDNDGDFDLYLGCVVDGDRGANFLFENFSTPTIDNFISWGSEHGEIVTDIHYTNSTTWGDFDNDGDLDLFASNWGNPDSNDVSRYYMNSGYPDYEFSVQHSLLDSLNPNNGTIIGFGRGAACADVDHDGDLDLAVARTGNPLLYLNQNTENNWVQINLKGNGTTNTSAIGARLRLVANISGQGGQTVQYREISGQTGAAGQNSLTAHFGLGDATRVDTLEITWPVTGNKETFVDLQVNQFYSFVETEVSGLKESSVTKLKSFKLFANYPNPFNPTTTISYQLPSSGKVKLSVYNNLGQEIRTLVNRQQSAGVYQQIFNGANLASGVYFYKLRAGDFVQMRKMMLVR